MDFDEKFFAEIEENKKLMRQISVPATFFGAVFLLWTYTNLEILRFQSQVFLFMLIIGAIIGGFDYFFPDNKMFNFEYSGKIENLKTGIMIGAAITSVLGLMWIIGALPFSITIPLSTTPSGVTALTSFIFNVVVASYVETKFFVQSTYPTAKKLFEDYGLNVVRSGFASILLVSFIFGIYHWGVVLNQGGILIIPQASIFMALSLLLVRYTRTTFSAWSIHFVNNLIAFIVSYGIIQMII